MSPNEGEEELTDSHPKNWTGNDANNPHGNSGGSIMKKR